MTHNEFENNESSNQAPIDMPVVGNGRMTVRKLWLKLEELGLNQSQVISVVNFMIDEGLARPESCRFTQAHTREFCGNPGCREN